jgi:CelD/BcsL family acetyltransferase involved in cellulose biosynthesis
MTAPGRAVLKFYFGPFLVARCSLRLRVVDAVADPDSAVPAGLGPDMSALSEDEQGFLFRSLPVSTPVPRYAVTRNAVRYVPQQFNRQSIDLTMGYEAYLRTFSSKTRSTLQRKVRRFADLPGGMEFRVYRSPEELGEFHAAARSVSALTYQERLYGAAIPDGAEFIAEMRRLATADSVRGYLLFLGGKPVSYLYCPIDRKRLIYAFLGYDPHYAKHSPGTVLQMLALSDIFGEQRFAQFDFTEGEGEHKRLFSTYSVPSANVYFLRRTALMQGLVLAHGLLDWAGNNAVQTVDRLRLKSFLRKRLRGHA